MTRARISQVRWPQPGRQHYGRSTHTPRGRRSTMLHRLLSMTVSFAGAITAEQIAQVVFEQCANMLDARTSVFAMLNSERSVLELIHTTNYPAETPQCWSDLPLTSTHPLAEVVRTGETLFIGNLDQLVAHYPYAHETPPYGAWAITPLAVDGNIIGSMLLAFDGPHRFSAEQRAFVVWLAQQCAQALERARLYQFEQRARAEAEAARERSAFLSEASRLLNSSLDYQSRFTNILRLIVPRLADYAIFYRLEPDETLKQVAMAHVDPRKEPLLTELQARYQVDRANPESVVARVIDSQKPVLASKASLQDAQRITSDERLIAIYRELNPQSYMMLPLISRDTVLGTLLLASAESERHYNSDDLIFATEVARRSALAIDNARLYQEAQDAIRIRDTFLSVAAHELKNPLTSLLGQAQLLRKRLAAEEILSDRNQRSIDVIVSQSIRLTQMVNAMLDISRLEHGQLTIEQASCDICALARQVVDELQPTITRHSLIYNGLSEPVIVNGDALRLEQVLQNLIDNAVKYSPDGGVIEVRVERGAQWGCIIVADQGVGISAEELPRLFQRFYRVGNADSQHVIGMGVGLYVVQEIARLHGGLIEVASREGQGSTFTVKLPLAESPPSAHP